MNSTEMYYEFSRLLEIVDPSYEVENKLDTDSVFMILNVAQLRYINKQYLNKETIAENIEALQERATYLQKF